MILVTLGTQKQDFSRLLKYIEDSNIKDEIIVQAGYTKFKSKKMKIFDFISYEEMEDYINKADFVITHSGTGSVLTPLKKGKKVIVCARLSKYGEHIDDHQKQLVEIFKDEGYVLELTEDNSIDELVKDLKKFKPKKYVSNTDNFVNKLKEEISVSKKIENTLICWLFIAFILLGICLLVFRQQKEISATENRYLNKIDLSLINKFSTGKFQNNIENALPDQIILSETFKKFGNVINKIARNISLALVFDFDKYGVEPYANELDLIKGTDYIVYREYDYNNMLDKSKPAIKIIKSVAEKHSDIPVYVYKVNREVDFKYREKFDSYIHEFFDGKVKYSSFSKINSYDDYMNYFYKSDHHWNNVGQYEGYKEIAELLGIKDIIQIEKVDCLNGIQFRGSKARAVGDTKIMDDFCVNIYDMAEYEITLSGNIFDLQGTRERYTLRNDPIISDISHYAQYYGHDYGELVYKFKDNYNKNNLLMFVDSFSNPINELVAANYNNTYVVDLRHYHELTGNEFNLDEYIKNNSIDEILVFGNINFFMDPTFHIDKEVN